MKYVLLLKMAVPVTNDIKLPFQLNYKRLDVKVPGETNAPVSTLAISR